MSPSCAPLAPPQVLSHVPQLPSQQSPSPLHVSLSAVHAPQTLFVHAPEQQSVGAWQPLPSAAQVSTPQTLLELHVPEQQSLACVQDTPSAAHVLIAQVAFWHRPEQQSVGSAQLSPLAAHPPAPHTPAVQRFPQQSVAFEHGSPSLEQVGVEIIISASAPASPDCCWQTPDAEQKSPAQQSSCVWHGSSVAPHAAAVAGTHCPAPPSASQT